MNVKSQLKQFQSQFLTRLKEGKTKMCEEQQLDWEFGCTDSHLHITDFRKRCRKMKL